jgi:hypothetical protein
MRDGHKAASATSEVTSLESSYARIIRDDTAEPTTKVAENHNDVLQAAYLFTGIRGVTDRPLLQLRKSRGLFKRPVKQCRTDSDSDLN